ncbi:hypothetical protein HY338_03930 [Candidatus Gottesmanbacteria bacterium]|nr:hypothetical protein [Candidatus Gottesmanbacteria bacterium]
MIEAMPQAVMGTGSFNGHGYSAGREFLSIQKVFDKTKSITQAARAGAEDFVGFKKEFADLATILSFSYEVRDGRWMNNGRRLDEINDPDEIGGDRILRVLSAEKAMSHDPSITQAAVISEDLGLGRSYLYLFSKNADNPNEISALAIEYQGSQEALGNFVQNLWSRSDLGGGDARKVDFAKPIFFTNSTSVGVHDIFDLAQKSLQKETGDENTRSYLSRFARDAVDFPSVLARQEMEIENLTRKYQEQMLKDTDVISGIASIVAGSVTLTTRWQETIDVRSKLNTVPPLPNFYVRNSTPVRDRLPGLVTFSGTPPLEYRQDIPHPKESRVTEQEDREIIVIPDSVFYVPAVLFFIRTSETNQEDRPKVDNETTLSQWENPDTRIILLTGYLLKLTDLTNEEGNQTGQLFPTYSEADFTQLENYDTEDNDMSQPVNLGANNPDSQSANDGMKLNTTNINDNIQSELLTVLNPDVRLLNETDEMVELLTLLVDTVHSESPQPFKAEKVSEKVQALILRIVENLLNNPKGESSENKKQAIQESLTRLTFWNKILTGEKTPSLVKRIMTVLIYLEIRERRFTHVGSSDVDNLLQQLLMTRPEKIFYRELFLLRQLVTVFIPQDEKMKWVWQDLSKIIFILLCFLVRMQKLEHIKPSSSDDGKYSWEKLLGLLKIRNMLKKAGRNKKMKRIKSTVIFQYFQHLSNTRLLEKGGVFVTQ